MASTWKSGKIPPSIYTGAVSWLTEIRPGQKVTQRPASRQNRKSSCRFSLVKGISPFCQVPHITHLLSDISLSFCLCFFTSLLVPSRTLWSKPAKGWHHLVLFDPNLQKGDTISYTLIQTCKRVTPSRTLWSKPAKVWHHCVDEGASAANRYSHKSIEIINNFLKKLSMKIYQFF